jgi:hypothetical protein
MTLSTNDLIRDVLGENHPVPFGWLLLIEPYKIGDKFVDSDGEATLFERPDSSKDRDRYQMGIGRILMMGDSAFKSPQFTGISLFPKVGDWIKYPKFNGDDTQHMNKEIVYLKDYLVMGIVPDPSLCGGHSFVGN